MQKNGDCTDGPGQNVLGTDNRLVMTRRTVVRTRDQFPEIFQIGEDGISFTYYPQQYRNPAGFGIHSVSIEGWCVANSGRNLVGEL
jgi:hypothetical protein